MNAKHLPVLLYGLAVLLAVFAYFYGLDSQYIPKNGDEYPYAHITRLTAESGHLLPLQSQLDHMRDTKPPLLFWQGIAATDWGQDWDLWHLRIPSVIYTLLTALLVFVLTLRLSGKTETGLVAVLAWLAFFSTYRYGRPFLANPPEVFWMTLPFFILLSLPRATFDSRLTAPLLLGLALGVGLLYKSFALLAPAGITLAWWYLHQRRYNWHAFITRDGAKLTIIVAAALAVFALWFALDPNPGAVWREFVLRENLGKLDAHGAGYFSTLLWGGSSVWALLLGYPLNAGLLAVPVAALMWAAWRRRAEMRDAEKMLWMLVAVLFLVFALPSQRSARYLLEGMPALAVLLAMGWQRVGRWAFAVSLGLAGLALALFGFLSRHLQHALGGTLYPAAWWLLLGAAIALIAAGLVLPRLTRPFALVAPFVVYLSFSLFLQPFDGAFGHYSSHALSDVRGKMVWTPCDFRAKDEGHRFLLPGARVSGYYESAALTPAELAKRYRMFAVQLPLGEQPACEACTVIGSRLEIRGRQSGAEIKDMLKGNVFPHLFVREWLVESASAPADPAHEQVCR
ncbi:MAG TPA: phospholipid carrier-dependent glycosyltransferase [Gallionellaceae bacterium]|nr:phospholipid carrier-dependent glycosyltransferase [Gallionellaceae bacterium]